MTLACPSCRRAIREDPAGATCAGCGARYRRTRGVLDLASEDGADAEDGYPANASELERALEALARGEAIKAALEDLLARLSDDAADRTMQILRESRGAWVPLLCASGGRALVRGNALSGTAVALARCGFDVTLADGDRRRLAFGLARLRELAPRTSPAAVRVREGAPWPFEDGSFEVAVDERGPEGFGELRRVARGEAVCVAQNRLAYKRNDLRRGRFQVPTPLQFARRALAHDSRERTLAGYRALAGAGARAFALYPTSGDFSFVAGLDGRGPRLLVGPKERRNRWKVAAERAGLFPWLTPSYLLVAPRAERAPAPHRLERALALLARRLGEDTPDVDALVATRGQSAVALTSGVGGRARWCVHVPLCPAQAAQVARHARLLRALPTQVSGLPLPELLFEGDLEGLWMSVERRLEGLTAPQISGDLARVQRMLADAARHLALLAHGPARRCDEAEFERLMGRRFALVARHARDARALAELDRTLERVRARLLGRAFPRALMHQDLRGKHVQVDADGRVLGYLDWGTADEEGLPYFDLVHLLVHERKQEAGLEAGAAWRLVRDGRALRDHERAALDGYARAVGLDDVYREAIVDAYPVLVAAMSEAHWDYSRPLWLARQFAFGAPD